MMNSKQNLGFADLKEQTTITGSTSIRKLRTSAKTCWQIDRRLAFPFVNRCAFFGQFVYDNARRMDDSVARPDRGTKGSRNHG